MKSHPSYPRVFLTFARNSLIRDMTFRTNFLLEAISSAAWTVMNVGFYLIVFHYAPYLGARSSGPSGEHAGWDRWEFFVFLATTWLINSLVQAFFMPNADEFSELIRTGNLDFALVKPIDTQFLVSCQRVDWSSLVNLLTGLVLLVVSLGQLTSREADRLTLHPISVFLYVFYIFMGVAILYSLMIALASTSVWLGRNQSLYDFWFYLTNFSRYPMEIYHRGWGISLWFVFTFLVPVLLVVNVPARILARPFGPHDPWQWPLAVFALAATATCLTGSRWVFQRALRSYRSASS